MTSLANLSTYCYGSFSNLLIIGDINVHLSNARTGKFHQQCLLYVIVAARVSSQSQSATHAGRFIKRSELSRPASTFRPFTDCRYVGTTSSTHRYATSPTLLARLGRRQPEARHRLTAVTSHPRPADQRLLGVLQRRATIAQARTSDVSRRPSASAVAVVRR